VWGIWFIITLVTHSSGVSTGIHHKCKHPLNPTGLYVFGWVESSLSVLIWKVITCLNDVCILDCESISDYIDEIFLALAYPFLVWMSCMLFFYFCDDHQFIDGSRCERYSWSTGERWFRCIVYLGWTSFSCWVFLYGYGPCTRLTFRFLYVPFKLYNLFSCVFLWHCGVPWVVRS